MSMGRTSSHKQRADMVAAQLRTRGIRDERVLNAMLKVPRELFLPEASRLMAYWDAAVEIGYEQSMSQPYIVALMTELAQVKKNSVVLEIGTGSGYQTSILAELAGLVCTIESNPILAHESRILLTEMGYGNIEFFVGDGYLGCPTSRMFDTIVVTAAPPTLPEKLAEQLVDGGRLVAPIGATIQDLYCIEKHAGRLQWQQICGVTFVAMKHVEQQSAPV